MPVCLDHLYNLIVCKECGIGVPFEYVSAHLKNNHGVSVTIDQVSIYLNLELDSMTVSEAREWISSVWVGRAVQNIAVRKGHKCNKCQYSAISIGVMRKHFSEKHMGLKMREYIGDCKVLTIGSLKSRVLLR
jgi:Orsellinic acid/F9775 biosynthesis cluster protein D